MIYTMSKPSENMLKPLGDIARMTREQNAELIKEQDQKIALEQASADRAYREYMAEQTNRIRENAETAKRNKEYLTNLKTSLLSECMYKLYKESAVGPMNNSDKVVAKNLINSFIKENGVNNLLIDFSTKNMLLSEFARIVDKYYNKTIEEACNDPQCEDRPAIGLEVKECDFNQTIADDFFKDLVDVDMDDASQMIKHRVSDAINDFIESNEANKLEYQDIIQAAQDRITSTTTEETAVSYMNQAKRQIHEAKQSKQKSIFHCLVESLTKAAMTDETLKAKYVHEATVDMEGIVNSAALIYTMLEMASTTNMVNVNEQFLDGYLASLTA